MALNSARLMAKSRGAAIPRIVFTPASPMGRDNHGPTMSPSSTIVSKDPNGCAASSVSGSLSEISRTLQNEDEEGSEKPPRSRHIRYSLEGGAPYPRRRSFPGSCSPREQCLLKTLCFMSVLLLVSFIAIIYLAVHCAMSHPQTKIQMAKALWDHAMGRTSLLKRQRSDNTIVCKVELGDLPVSLLWENLSVLEAQKFAHSFEKDVLTAFRAHNDSRSWDVTRVIVDGFHPSLQPVVHLHLSMRRPHFVQHVVEHFQLILAQYAEISPYLILHETLECANTFDIEIGVKMFHEDPSNIFERPFVYKELKHIISRCTWWNEVDEMDVVDMHAEKNGFLGVVVRIKLNRILTTKTIKKHILDIISLSLKLGPFDVDAGSVSVSDVTIWHKKTDFSKSDGLVRSSRRASADFTSTMTSTIVTNEVSIVVSSATTSDPPDLSQLLMEYDKSWNSEPTTSPTQLQEESFSPKKLFVSAPFAAGIPGAKDVPEKVPLSRRRGVAEDPHENSIADALAAADAEMRLLGDIWQPRQLLGIAHPFITPGPHQEQQIDRPFSLHEEDPYGISVAHSPRRRRLLSIDLPDIGKAGDAPAEEDPSNITRQEEETLTEDPSLAGGFDDPNQDRLYVVVEYDEPDYEDQVDVTSSGEDPSSGNFSSDYPTFGDDLLANAMLIETDLSNVSESNVSASRVEELSGNRLVEREALSEDPLHVETDQEVASEDESRSKKWAAYHYRKPARRGRPSASSSTRSRSRSRSRSSRRRPSSVRRIRVGRRRGSGRRPVALRRRVTRVRGGRPRGRADEIEEESAESEGSSSESDEQKAEDDLEGRMLFRGGFLGQQMLARPLYGRRLGFPQPFFGFPRPLLVGSQPFVSQTVIHHEDDEDRHRDYKRKPKDRDQKYEDHDYDHDQKYKDQDRNYEDRDRKYEDRDRKYEDRDRKYEDRDRKYEYDDGYKDPNDKQYKEPSYKGSNRKYDDRDRKYYKEETQRYTDKYQDPGGNEKGDRNREKYRDEDYGDHRKSYEYHDVQGFKTASSHSGDQYGQQGGAQRIRPDDPSTGSLQYRPPYPGPSRPHKNPPSPPRKYSSYEGKSESDLQTGGNPQEASSAVSVLGSPAQSKPQGINDAPKKDSSGKATSELDHPWAYPEQQWNSGGIFDIYKPSTESGSTQDNSARSGTLSSNLETERRTDGGTSSSASGSRPRPGYEYDRRLSPEEYDQYSMVARTLLKDSIIPKLEDSANKPSYKQEITQKSTLLDEEDPPATVSSKSDPSAGVKPPPSPISPPVGLSSNQAAQSPTSSDLPAVDSNVDGSSTPPLFETSPELEVEDPQEDDPGTVVIFKNEDFYEPQKKDRGRKKSKSRSRKKQKKPSKKIQQAGTEYETGSYNNLISPTPTRHELFPAGVDQHQKVGSSLPNQALPLPGSTLQNMAELQLGQHQQELLQARLRAQNSGIQPANPNAHELLRLQMQAGQLQQVQGRGNLPVNELELKLLNQARPAVPGLWLPRNNELELQLLNQARGGIPAAGLPANELDFQLLNQGLARNLPVYGPGTGLLPPMPQTPAGLTLPVTFTNRAFRETENGNEKPEPKEPKVKKSKAKRTRPEREEDDVYMWGDSDFGMPFLFDPPDSYPTQEQDMDEYDKQRLGQEANLMPSSDIGSVNSALLDVSTSSMVVSTTFSSTSTPTPLPEVSVIRTTPSSTVNTSTSTVQVVTPTTSTTVVEVTTTVPVVVTETSTSVMSVTATSTTVQSLIQTITATEVVKSTTTLSTTMTTKTTVEETSTYLATVSETSTATTAVTSTVTNYQTSTSFDVVYNTEFQTSVERLTSVVMVYQTVTSVLPTTVTTTSTDVSSLMTTVTNVEHTTSTRVETKTAYTTETVLEVATTTVVEHVTSKVPTVVVETEIKPVLVTETVVVPMVVTSSSLVTVYVTETSSTVLHSVLTLSALVQTTQTLVTTVYETLTTATTTLSTVTVGISGASSSPVTGARVISSDAGAGVAPPVAPILPSSAGTSPPPKKPLYANGRLRITLNPSLGKTTRGSKSVPSLKDGRATKRKYGRTRKLKQSATGTPKKSQGPQTAGRMFFGGQGPFAPEMLGPFSMQNFLPMGQNQQYGMGQPNFGLGQSLPGLGPAYPEMGFGGGQGLGMEALYRPGAPGNPLPEFMHLLPNMVSNGPQAAFGDGMLHYGHPSLSRASSREDAAHGMPTVCGAGNPRCGCRGRVSDLAPGRMVSRVCDGHCDCKHCEDELGCAVSQGGQISESCHGRHNCHQCSPSQFYCAKPGDNHEFRCFDIVQRGDDNPQCSNGKDEEGTIKLDDANHPEHGYTGVKTFGVVYKMIASRWYLVCGQGVSKEELAMQACLATCGPRMSGSPQVSVEGVVPSPSGLYAIFQGGSWKTGQSCTGSLIRVVCPPPPCGLVSSHGRAFKRSPAQDVNNTVSCVVDLLAKDGKQCEEVSSSSQGISGRFAGLSREEENGDEGRIVGGVDSSDIQPWLVTIYHNGQFFCGGAIIHPSWVLTAAHCFYVHSQGTTIQYTKTNYVIGAGLLRKLSSSPYAQFRTARLVIPHERYSGKEVPEHLFLYDITLMLVLVPFHMNLWVNRICLPNPGEHIPHDLPCIVAGWGALRFDGNEKPDHLQEVTVRVIEPCVFIPYVVENKGIQFCAGYVEGKKDSCTGDSGGPLVCSLNGQLVVVGVVSHGKLCAASHSPGVYTRVPAFIEWIKAVIHGESMGKYSNHMFETKPNCPGKVCAADGRCIRTKEVCDGKSDCPALGDDESSCAGRSLYDPDGSSHGYAHGHPRDGILGRVDAGVDAKTDCYHKCDGGSKCIPKEKTCDFNRDCADGTDETNCTCADFYGSSSEYDPFVCDGFGDCSDGSDELDCEALPDYLNCTGKCVCALSRGEKRCTACANVLDGKPDCDLGEEEIVSYANAAPGFVMLEGLDGMILRLKQGVVCQLHPSEKDALWYPVCFQFLDSYSFKQLGDEMCQMMTYESAISVTRQEVFDGQTCQAGYFHMNVTCGQRTCGLREVTMPLPDAPVTGSNPWSCNLFVEGNYVCTGVLETEVMCAFPEECASVLNLRKDFAMVLVGMGYYMPLRTRVEENVRVTNKLCVDGVCHLRLAREVQPSVSSIPACPTPSLKETDLPLYAEMWVLGKHISMKLISCKAGGGICVEFPGEQKYDCELVKAGVPVIQRDGRYHEAGAFARKTCDASETIALRPIVRLKDELPPASPGYLENIPCPQPGAIRSALGGCIAKEQICDGVWDCREGRDEQNCAAKPTMPSRRCVDSVDPATGLTLCECQYKTDFKCANNGCVDSAVVCDGNDNCYDGSDETCSCLERVRKRQPGKICDCHADCPLAEDENAALCGCKPDEFRCCSVGANGERNVTCIPKSERCNQKAVCINYSDEEDCVALIKKPGDFKLDQLGKPTKFMASGFLVTCYESYWNFFSCAMWDENEYAAEACYTLGYFKGGIGNTTIPCPTESGLTSSTSLQYLRKPPDCCVYLNCAA